MSAFISDLLMDAGYDISFAYYQPYSLSPELSVPLHRLASYRVGTVQSRYHGCHAYAIGAWLPEFEFTHYWATRHWHKLIAEHDVHLSVSGNCLASMPFAACNIPFWSWVATDWAGDRVQRVNEYPWFRKILDRLITASGAKKLERKILDSSGTIIALSQHTKRALSNSTSRSHDIGLMPMGIDTKKFRQSQKHSARIPTIGFVGRLDDPRKNVDLLLRALDLCRRNGTRIRAILVGRDGRHDIKRRLETTELGGEVTIVDYVDNNRLPELLSQMDVFVIPSHQEGLCIAALEAMSCGVPVISTRCGGPEEYVLDGETGYLVDGNPESLSKAISSFLEDSDSRESLSNNARCIVEKVYSIEKVEEKFWFSFNNTFDQYHAPGSSIRNISRSA